MITITVRGATQAVTVVTYATSQLLWQNFLKHNTTIHGDT